MCISRTRSVERALKHDLGLFNTETHYSCYVTRYWDGIRGNHYAWLMDKSPGVWPGKSGKWGKVVFGVTHLLGVVQCVCDCDLAPILGWCKRAGSLCHKGLLAAPGVPGLVPGTVTDSSR